MKEEQCVHGQKNESLFSVGQDTYCVHLITEHEYKTATRMSSTAEKWRDAEYSYA